MSGVFFYFKGMDKPIRNIAILAHVDAGKTTLSERILFTAGEVRSPGNVEDGLATMDYLPEEKERGITIEAGVAHFEWRGIWFNFIDTPGHVDFGAEVDMALSAVEGAILVVSAADGVETQTLAAWKKLREKRIRTLIFINKLDNPSYSLDDTLIAIEEFLNIKPLLLSVPEYSSGNISSELDVISSARLVHRNGKEEPDRLPVEDPAKSLLQRLYSEAVDASSEFDDGVLSSAMNGIAVPPKDLIAALEKLSASDKSVLCYAGSAKENFGVRSLMTGLSFFLPSPPQFDANCLGEVIRLRHFPDLGEIALFRSRAKVPFGSFPKGFSFFRMKASQLLPVEEILPGDIYAVRSEKPLSLGLKISLKGTPLCREPFFQSEKYNPLLQTHIECLRPEDFAQVEKSLEILSRMDPSIEITPHPEGGFWVLHTVGEVQLDVILERIKREFHCEVRAGKPDVLWQERLSHSMAPVKNSFQAGPFTVSLTLSAYPLPESDRDIKLSGAFLERAPREILAGIRSALLESSEIGFLGKGPLVGVGFEIHSFDSEGIAPVPMIKKACSDAVAMLIKPVDVVLYEPNMEISLECPVEYAGLVSGDILSRKGKIGKIGGNGVIHSLKAELPLRNLFGYSTAVRSISKGTAQYSLRFLGYEPYKM